MAIKQLLVLLALPLFSFSQGDSVGKKPDLAKIDYKDLKWMKSENNSFWFYYKPTEYFLKNTEFETFPLENGDFMVYIHALQKYLLLPNFTNEQREKEKPVELASDQPCVFIRSTKDRFWIFDRGQYIDKMERVGLNTEKHVYVYRSLISDKRYWIRESDFLYGPVSTVIGIVSE
jgi:intergrase/recombinase